MNSGRTEYIAICSSHVFLYSSSQRPKSLLFIFPSAHRFQKSAQCIRQNISQQADVIESFCVIFPRDPKPRWILSLDCVIIRCILLDSRLFTVTIVFNVFHSVAGFFGPHHVDSAVPPNISSEVDVVSKPLYEPLTD